MGNIAPMISTAALIGLYLHFFFEVFDPQSVAGKRVLITGASSGIGEELAYQYSRLGAKVYLTARRADLLEKVAKKCEELSAQQAAFAAADLAEQKHRDRVMTSAMESLGGLDLLILNHAVTSSGLWLGSRTNVSTLIRDLRVNFVSHVDLASQALPMLEKSSGAIGVVSSVAGRIPIAAFESYSADKFALQGFFGALGVELRHRNTGVTVTTCVLGPVDTDMARATNLKERVQGSWVWSGFGGMTTAKDTAIAIVEGVATRQREVYHGMVAWVLVILHRLCPGLVENWIGADPTLSLMG